MKTARRRAGVSYKPRFRVYQLTDARIPDPFVANFLDARAIQEKLLPGEIMQMAGYKMACSW
jgi:hypothetical protein